MRADICIEWRLVYILKKSFFAGVGDMVMGFATKMFYRFDAMKTHCIS
jgi:hypothetical protein